MTTALIGKHGAVATKARVAVVSKGGVGGIAALVARAGHEIQEYPDWDSLLADAPSDLVFFDDETAADLPDGLQVPAVQVTERSGTNPRTAFGVVPMSAVEQMLEPILTMAAELQMSSRRCRELEQLVEGVRSGSALVGRSPAMRRLQGVLSRAADSDATVLIEGPAGSGKSLAARVVHCKSRRSDKPLVVRDSGELDAESLGSAIESARGTTIVLEDIDRLNAPAQSVLVRHLKDRPTGRGDAASRLIVTTAAHLPELVARGAFREDLYYRLHAFPMVMPALRERIEDIAAIAESILGANAAASGRNQPGITAAALVLLESMSWPGNVAQLEAVLRRAQAFAGGMAVDREHLLTAPVATTATSVATVTNGPARVDVGEAGLTEDSIRPFEEEEQMLLSRALRATRGNVRRAAQLLGIGRATLYRKIQQYKLRLQ